MPVQLEVMAESSFVAEDMISALTYHARILVVDTVIINQCIIYVLVISLHNGTWCKYVQFRLQAVLCIVVCVSEVQDTKGAHESNCGFASSHFVKLTFLSCVLCVKIKVSSSFQHVFV